MKRSGFKTRGQPLRAKTQMRRVSKKKQQYRQSSEGRAALDYMGVVRTLPCIICQTHGEPQTSHTQAHHPIMGRYGTRKAPDGDCVALCEGHHQGMFDTSKIAIHREPKRWREVYGLDTDYIEATREAVKAL